MTALQRNELIESALDLVPWQARRFPRLPRGINVEDLESAGNEGLVNAAATWDPDHGTTWRPYARTCVRNAMRNAIRSARRRPALSIELEADDGTLTLPADPRAADPAERASARELVCTAGAEMRTHVKATGPDPAAVATRAVALREAMFGAIESADVAEVVRKVTERAKAGDLRAARLLFDLLAPGRSGATVIKQQAIIVHPHDIG